MDYKGSIRGTVFDDLISRNVLPVCAYCLEYLDYELDSGCKAGVNKLYVERLIANYPETAREMSAKYF